MSKESTHFVLQQRGAALTLILWLSAGLPAAATGAATVEEQHIDQPQGWWQRHGYVGLVPSLHLPTTRDGNDLIHVWLKLPEGSRIDAEYLDDRQRWSLLLPPGTRADRAEYYRLGGGISDEATHYLGSPTMQPEDLTLVDLRGTAVDEQGRQRFHVLRPTGEGLHPPLRGWSWMRGDVAARQQATNRLLDLVRHAAHPPGCGPIDQQGLADLRSFNACAGCHVPRRHRDTGEIDGVDPGYRITDNLGFFVPGEVLSDTAAVANHRPRDLNSRDPYVTVRCADQPARLVTTGGHERYVCPDGQAPMGHRDVRAGLAAGQAYTERLCQARHWFHEHMTERARQAYADALAACGIGEPDVEPTVQDATER